MRSSLALLLVLLASCRDPASPPGKELEIAPDASVPVLTGACARSGPSPWLKALRSPRSGESALIGRGQPWSTLAAGIDRAWLPGPSAPITVPAKGDTAAYIGATNQILRTAVAAFGASDAQLATRAANEIVSLRLDKAFFDAVVVDEATIRVGGGLVSLAEADDLVGAVLGPGGPLADAHAALRDSALAFHSFVSDPLVRAFLLVNRDNHGMKVGAGLVAARLALGDAAIPDLVLADGLALIAHALHGGQSERESGWAEGPGYFAFAIEAAGPVLLAIDAAWPEIAYEACLPCPGESGFCGDLPTLTFTRPSRDPVLRDALLWAASLVTREGWFFAIDDSRLAAPSAPLYDLLLGQRLFDTLPQAGISFSPLGAGNDLTPFVALHRTRAAQLPLATPPPPFWPKAGTSVLKATSTAGVPLQALLLAEQGLALEGGRGHERPEPLALSLVGDRELLLGGSGYSRYSERAAVARPDASTLITVDGTLPSSSGVYTIGPAATFDSPGAATTTWEGVTLHRSIALTPVGLSVTDRVELSAAHQVQWHFHQRGTATSDGRSWSVNGVKATLTLPPSMATACTGSAAPGSDVGQTLVPHPVLRCALSLPPGITEVSWSVAVTR